jgi:hypothetical protein
MATADRPEYSKDSLRNIFPERECPLKTNWVFETKLMLKLYYLWCRIEMTIYCNVAQVMRGVQKINSQTVTSSMLGVFRCRIFLSIFAKTFPSIDPN